MFDALFVCLFDPALGITLNSFLICLGTALGLGAVIALTYTFRNLYTRSFVVTLATLPAVVCSVIMMVSGNLGAGVAVAGTFSLVRFRSTPGTAREIGAVFLTMAVGLACGMGYAGFAVLFAVIMCLVHLLYSVINFGGVRNEHLRKELRITIPEDLDYGDIFTDIFAQFTSQSRLTAIKTTNLGSLNKLTYDVTLKTPGTEKAFLDALRCRNGNLEISLSVRAMDNRDL
jgi:hypothetical protein